MHRTSHIFYVTNAPQSSVTFSNLCLWHLKEWTRLCFLFSVHFVWQWNFYTFCSSSVHNLSDGSANVDPLRPISFRHSSIVFLVLFLHVLKHPTKYFCMDNNESNSMFLGKLWFFPPKNGMQEMPSYFWDVIYACKPILPLWWWYM
jgi:hypothetical protein